MDALHFPTAQAKHFILPWGDRHKKRVAIKKCCVLFCFLLYCFLASVKSYYGLGGWARIALSPTVALPKISCQCGLSISYIFFDMSDIFNQRRGFVRFSSEDRVGSRMDVGDGWPEVVPLPAVSAHLAIWVCV